MKIFYRVLYGPVRFGDQILDPGTVQRWLEKRFSSTHSRVPGPWRERWKQDKSADPRDYPLRCEDVEYTPEALQAFLRFAPEYGDFPVWPEEIRNRTGEYLGVSAFDDPDSALAYAQGPPKLYVVFKGEAIGPLPEEDEGGYRVRVIDEVDGPMREEAFLAWLRRHLGRG